MNSWFLKLRGKCVNRLLQAGMAVTGILLTTSAAQASSSQPQNTDSIVGIEDLAEPRPCDPVAVYGPPQCSSDKECVAEHGEGWYCNTNHSYDDGCGGKIEWPVCDQKAPVPTPVEPPKETPKPIEEPKDDDRDAPCVYGPAPVDD